MAKSARLLSIFGAALLAGCLFGADEPDSSYAPVAELSGSWGERPSAAFAFAGRVDTFHVSGDSVRMVSRVWTDVIPCARDTAADSLICVHPPEREYYRGRYSLRDSLLTFRVVRSDAIFSQASGDTVEFSWVAEGYNSRNGKLKLRRNGLSRNYEPVCAISLMCIPSGHP